jgi:hypothetical protein
MVNYEGSSGAMESKLAVKMIHDTWNKSAKKVTIGTIIADDDSTLKANTKNKKNGGLVNDEVETPNFLADPSHRIKCIIRSVYKLVKKNKDPNSIKTIDAMRLKKYLSCYIRQCRTDDFDTFFANRYAALEHLFDNHVHCNGTWCYHRHVQDVLHKKIIENRQGAPAVDSVPRDVIAPEYRDESDDIITVENDNETEIVSEAAYTKFEQKWMDFLGYSTSQIAEGSEDSGGETQGEEEYSSDEGDDDVDDDDEMISSGVDAEEVGLRTMESEMSIETVMMDYSIHPDSFEDGCLESLKKKEEELVRRKECGYYRSKVKHPIAYNKIAEAISPYLTKERMMELHHKYDTQKNEAMNQSVSSYAPKTKTYSKTNSLDARVALAAAIEVAGYRRVWENFFFAFGVDLNENLTKVLDQMDHDKLMKTIKAISGEGKLRRSAARTSKMKKMHQQDMTDQADGVGYATGIALKKATLQVKNKVKSIARNPKGTLPSLLKCKFHHERYCQKLGHTRSNHKDCFMLGKTREERDAAEKEIRKELLEQELEKGNTKRK